MKHKRKIFPFNVQMGRRIQRSSCQSYVLSKETEGNMGTIRYSLITPDFPISLDKCSTGPLGEVYSVALSIFGPVLVGVSTPPPQMAKK